jgi:hypothetical protein
MYGSGWSPLLLQKCIPRVFELENLNPFSIAHFSILFRHSCNCLSTLFIFLLLSDREFNVRVNSTYSDIQEQEMGVPQGSILSVTLLSIKINSLAKVLNDNIEGSIGELDNFNSGSGWRPLLLQTCIPRVFELDNLNPFFIAHFSILFRHSCNCLSMLFIFLPR